jgi:hypothetical protein
MGLVKEFERASGGREDFSLEHRKWTMKMGRTLLFSDCGFVIENDDGARKGNRCGR